MCYQVNSYIHGRAGVLLWKNDLDIFQKKILQPIPLGQRHRPTHGTRVGLGTHRGSRLPYVHAQCMPIWVPGSRVLGSSGPRSPGPGYRVPFCSDCFQLRNASQLETSFFSVPAEHICRHLHVESILCYCALFCYLCTMFFAYYVPLYPCMKNAFSLRFS